MTDTRHIHVFFSWQSDLSQGPTTQAIRTALRAAMSEIEAAQNVHIILEEATSNVSGSPYIPYELAEKIRKSDIFVCDITTVTRVAGENEQSAGKSFPNANVTFELGVASAQVGWNRVIMLFNKEFGELEGLPFDFDRHRISTFRMKEGAAPQKSGAGALKSLLVAAISQIVKDSPPRPRELEGTPASQIKRERDIENIRWFMRQFSVGLLDRHIRNMPDYLYSDATFMSAGICGVMESSNFRLYDQDVDAAAKKLHAGLEQTLDHIAMYRHTPNSNLHIFGSQQSDFGLSTEELAARASIIEGRDRLAEGLSTLIDLVRERYLEIDIDETNQLFVAGYNAMHQRFN